ncbi:hypothetical protein BV898_17007 [Hypsibius exemplaris]|uniref:Uncharacterized protein n=1 Tax=Hypsibius exemplaris TaxID=2072580 RepID=A0A9X6NLJ1_HYPEX|nr:hypothetical protein BV898_17007 [Hypsibius exemplaris]
MAHGTLHFLSFVFIGTLCGIFQQYQSAPQSLTGEDLFKSLFQALARDDNDLPSSLADHGDAAGVGFFENVIIRLGRDVIILKQALNDSFPPITGEECLTVHTEIGYDVTQAILHRNDPILGNVTGLPLQGEQLYQQKLQQWGSDLQALLTAAQDNKGASYPGKWLSALLKLSKDIDQIQVITSTNDTGPACLAATRALGNSFGGYSEARSATPATAATFYFNPLSL